MTGMEALYLALGSERGIVLKCFDFVKVRAQLYAARRALADPALDCLAFRQGPDDELWIVKK